MDPVTYTVWTVSLLMTGIVGIVAAYTIIHMVLAAAKRNKPIPKALFGAIEVFDFGIVTLILLIYSFLVFFGFGDRHAGLSIIANITLAKIVLDWGIYGYRYFEQRRKGER